MKKYPKLRYPGDEETEALLQKGYLTILEKIDGANFRFQYRDGDLLCGSRNVVFSKGDDPLPIEECNEAFRHVIKYLQNTVDYDELEAIGEDYGDDLVFYGESLHKHSIDYDAWEGKHPDDEDIPNFLGFDVYDPTEEEFVEWLLVETLFGAIGLETVPVMDRGVSVDEFNPVDYEIPPSSFRKPDEDADEEFDEKGLAEGVVLRNDTTGVSAKLVHPDFMEKNAICFNDVSKARTQAGAFVAKYVTDARIEKQVHKLVDEGEYEQVEMPMMQDLPMAVLVDAVEENARDFVTRDGPNLTLDEEGKHQIRRKASQKCVDVLKKTIRENMAQ